MNATLRSVLRECLERLAWWAARSYVAGPDLSDSVLLCRRLAQRSIPSTICYWNSDDDQPGDIARRNHSVLRSITAFALDARLAIKAPAMRFDAGLVLALADAAREAGVCLHFDAHAHEVTGPTLDLVAAAAGVGASVGCTLPGRWRRSLDDADWAAEHGVNVRVVKGQWDAPGSAAADPRAGYLAVIDRLARRARHVSVATHDPGLAREALERLLPDTPCELELLFGLPMKEPMRVAREFNVPVRIYAPYGRAWLPYALKRTLKDTPLALRAARDVLLGRSFRLLR